MIVTVIQCCRFLCREDLPFLSESYSFSIFHNSFQFISIVINSAVAFMLNIFVILYNDVSKESCIIRSERQFERDHFEEDIIIRDIRYTFLRL